MLKDSKAQRVLIAGAFIIVALALYNVNTRWHISNSFSLSLSDLAMLAAAFIAGYPIAVNAIQALRYRILGIDARYSSSSGRYFDWRILGSCRSHFPLYAR